MKPKHLFLSPERNSVAVCEKSTSDSYGFHENCIRFVNAIKKNTKALDLEFCDSYPNLQLNSLQPHQVTKSRPNQLPISPFSTNQQSFFSYRPSSPVHKLSKSQNQEVLRSKFRYSSRSIRSTNVSNSIPQKPYL